MKRHTTTWWSALAATCIASICTVVLANPAQAAAVHRVPPTTTTQTVAGSRTPIAPGARPSSVTPGYWIASSAGKVGSFGGALFRSSLGANHVDAPVVALTPTHDGGGYWLAAADGGVFGFGDAGYSGSLSALQLAAPVVAVVPTPDGRGYWLAAADGGVFAFGDAHFFGSPTGIHLTSPIVGAAASAGGAGYWLAAADGGVFAYGAAHFYGSVSAAAPVHAVASIAPTPDARGYWLASADGGVFAFGDASFRGSATGDVPPGESIVAIAAGPGVTNFFGTSGNFSKPAVSQSAASAPSGSVGYDISWPQCTAPFPASSALAIVGINRGTAFTGNPCFEQEAAWAGRDLSVYMNLNSPDPTDQPQSATGPAGTCPPGAAACDSFDYGSNAATDALARVHLAGYAPRIVWLDVETSNVWSPDTVVNDQVIAGALTALRKAGETPGIYSTGYQFSVIAGSFNPSTVEWLATGATLTSPSPGCATPSFTGGPVTLVQGSLGPFDGNYAC